MCFIHCFSAKVNNKPLVWQVVLPGPAFFDTLSVIIISLKRLTGGHIVIPYIDYSLCAGCEACTKIYPMFFEMKNDLPWLINHEKFIFEEHKDIPDCCPFRAITIE